MNYNLTDSEYVANKQKMINLETPEKKENGEAVDVNND